MGQFDFADFNRNLILDATLYFGDFSGFFRVIGVTKESRMGDSGGEFGFVDHSLDAFFPRLVGSVMILSRSGIVRVNKLVKFYVSDVKVEGGKKGKNKSGEAVNKTFVADVDVKKGVNGFINEVVKEVFK